MEEQVKIKVFVCDKEYEYWAIKGQDLWTFLTANNFYISDNCGGKGYCGKCRIKVKGIVSEITPEEREKLLLEEIREGIRLACHCRIKGEVSVYLENREILPLSYKAFFDLEKLVGENKAVKVINFFIPGVDKYNPVPVYDRLSQALADYKLKLSTANINELLLLDRPGRPVIELQALVFYNKIVKRVEKRVEKAYGIAFDIGTTSLFAALVDLENGEVAAVTSQTNMQRVYGSDVIARVSYCLENSDGTSKLHQILINNINGMIQELKEQKNILISQVYKIAAVGNPVMLHFLTGLSVKGFSAAPYVGLFSAEMKLNAASLGINVDDETELVILPQIGGFVGADTVACILSLEPEVPLRYLLIDIGTNGEIVLSVDGKMWAASAAAGPAFEGGNITSGGRAAKGSINKFYLDEGENIRFTFIGEGPVKNICGSGVIDLVSCLLTAGYIDDKGIITEKALSKLKIADSIRGKEIIICDDIKKVKNTPVVFNQEDIRQIQMAKAAVRTAIDILLSRAGIKEEDLEYVFLAGTFGSYLDPQSCMNIGLLPQVDIAKVKNLGNAAARGAVMSLLSGDMIYKAREIKEKTEYVELALEPLFQKIFLNNLNF